jgi:hypothetical protein
MNANKVRNQAVVIDVAIEFIAHPGNAERALAVHRKLADGLCAGCLTQLARWPCSVAHIALQAQRLHLR